MGLFDSGPLPPGAGYAFTFEGAGTYRVVDNDTGHSSSVRVPVKVDPAVGSVDTALSIVWAATPPPLGYLYRVQVRRPGSLTWRTLFARQTGQSASFIPDAGVGTYYFRARLYRAGSAAHSGWSPKASAVVTD
jgi:hypothetical protein